jgi:hypothetical protein
MTKSMNDKVYESIFTLILNVTLNSIVILTKTYLCVNINILYKIESKFVRKNAHNIHSV